MPSYLISRITRPDNHFGGPHAPLSVADEEQRETAIKLLKVFSGQPLAKWREAGVIVVSASSRGVSDHDDHSRDLSVYSLGGDGDLHWINTSNCMGVVRLTNREKTRSVVLEIKSRFDEGRGQLFLNHLLSRVFGGNFVDENVDASPDSTWEVLLAFAFRKRLLDAWQVGLFKKYRKVEQNDLRFRGKFNVDEHLRRNVPLAAAVAYTTHDITFDNALNQLIRHALDKVIRKWPGVLAGSNELTCLRRGFEQNTPSWQRGDVLNCIRQNLRPVRHPYFGECYEPLRQVSLSILREEGASLYTASQEVEGVLFDGSWLWEEYLWTLLKPVGFQHPQNREHIGRWKPLKDVTYYPDFYHPGRRMVLDAKYTQAGHREDHVRQVLAYMYVGNAGDGGLITPKGKDWAREDIRRIGGAAGNWHDLALCVPHAEDAKTFREKIATAERLLVRNLHDYCQATNAPEPLYPPIHLTQGSDVAAIEGN